MIVGGGEGEKNDSERADRNDACGKSVESVEELRYIHHHEEPDEDEDIRLPRLEQDHAAERVRQLRYFYAAGDRRKRGHDRKEHREARLERKGVVKKTAEHEHRAANKEADVVARVNLARRQTICKNKSQDQCNAKRDKNGQTAQERNWFLVHFSRHPRLVNNSKRRRHSCNKRRKRGREKET